MENKHSWLVGAVNGFGKIVARGATNAGVINNNQNQMGEIKTLFEWNCAIERALPLSK